MLELARSLGCRAAAELGDELAQAMDDAAAAQVVDLIRGVSRRVVVRVAERRGVGDHDAGQPSCQKDQWSDQPTPGIEPGSAAPSEGNGCASRKATDCSADEVRGAGVADEADEVTLSTGRTG